MCPTLGYYRDAKFDSEWKLDREAGVEMLAMLTDRLKNFKVKVQPMLGCVGVARPANQSFREGWLGSWGGNMDYNGNWGVLDSSGYGLAAFRVAGALGLSFRFQQRDEGVPRRPGGPPYLGCCRSNYLSQAHAHSTEFGKE